MTVPQLNFNKNVVNERLKQLDGLVRAHKIDEAFEEITQIRKLDSTNPYAFAYEERIKTLRQTTLSQTEAAPAIAAPAHPEPRMCAPAPASGVSNPSYHPTPAIPATGGVKVFRPGSPITPKSHIETASRQLLCGLPRSRQTSARILFVDDDTMLVQALRQFLEDNQYTVLSFSQSEDALEYLKENAPDLIISDVNLETSSFGGFALHEKVRRFGHLRNVPFVFLSGLSDSAIVLAGKESGADDYLMKPIDPEELLSVVKGKLKRYGQIRKKTSAVEKMEVVA